MRKKNCCSHTFEFAEDGGWIEGENEGIDEEGNYSGKYRCPECQMLVVWTNGDETRYQEGKETIKIFEMFAGYGTATFALKELGLDFELVGFSEIDRFAHTCFNQNHGGFNYGDATKINPEELPDFNLLTAGFPCQAFSVAGKGLGELDTRGTLFHEVIRIAEAKKPRWMLLENVKGLTTKRHKETFEKILSELRRIGYYVDWKIINSKNHGVPQNRERVWFACFREFSDREMFKWPADEELKIFVKDILEENVDEKYYLSDAHIKRLLTSTDLEKKFSAINPDIVLTMTARQFANYKGNYIMKVGDLDSEGWEKRNESSRRIYSPEGICPTIPTSIGGGHTPKFIVASRGRNKENPSDRTKGLQTEQRLEPRFDGLSNSLTSVQKDNLLFENYRIRKLTPKECFRLQGFLNDQINLEGISDSQQYKLAGNGQTLSVVKAIFREMLK